MQVLKKVHDDDLDDGYNVVSESEALIKQYCYDTKMVG